MAIKILISADLDPKNRNAMTSVLSTCVAIVAIV